MRRTGKRKIAFGLGLGVFLCLAVWGGGVWAQEEIVITGTEPVDMDFENMDIRLVIKYISDLTGKNFIIDNDVRGTVTVIAPSKIPPDEAYKVFESILEVRGFVAVPAGKIIKVSRKQEGAKRNIKMRVGAGLAEIPLDDAIVTQLIPLQYASVDKIRNALGQLFSKDASVIPYPTTNTLIVTDIGSNIRRLVEIIKELDVPGYETRITVAPLRYAAADTIASELAQVIEEVGQVPGSPPTPRRREKGQLQPSEKLIKIIPDERTNSLIVLANEEDTKRVLELIKKLDVETERSNIHVYFLKNSDADSMAKVLNSIVSKRKPKGGEAVPLISEDTATNSLIIDATPEDYADLQNIIRKLDIMRNQVLVEVLIAEVSYEKSFDLGVEWKSIENNGFPDYDNMGTGRNNAEGFGGSTFDGGGLSSYLTSSEGQRSSGLSGLSLGFVQKVAGAGSSIPDFSVLLTALQTNKDVNVLSTPQILTMDNEEASINVGQNIPYKTKYEVGTSTTNAAQNIEYKDVGIKLTITPHISQDGMVRLEIDQSISSLAGKQVAGIALTPVTYTRETKTSVMVRNNHTIVISGLIRDNKTETVDKIPILGDIPLLGLLFRKKSTSSTKTNLLVFITPRVVRTTQQIADLTTLKRHEMTEIDKRLTEVEEETRARENELREEEKTRLAELKSRYGQWPASGESEAKDSSAPPAEEEVNQKEAPSGSLLDMLPKISFREKEEDEIRSKAAGRYHH